ncbi:alpha-2,8-sialyltransferase 8B-like isoform X2 [Branchiostoma lanceolatum]|uniref:alpha-2,8-sialyltransferase 8B-like isoform X2 n=2 Tax=Branchiostoma lanceolatum TaxID=7740 RepID=UPI0034547711
MNMIHFRIIMRPRILKKLSLLLVVVATAMAVVSYRPLSTWRVKKSGNTVRGPSHLYVHVPIYTAQRQNWTNYLMIRNALEGFFNPRVRIVRATTPAESLERCRKDAGKGKGCLAITPIRHYSTCALVGNSGILLNSSCGDNIDSNDFVIRFNLGPLQDYSKDIGRNVNMTVINREIVRKLFPMLRKNKTSEIVNLLRPFNNSILLLAKGSYSTKFLAECKSMENIMRGRGLNFTIALSNFNGTGTDKRLWAGLGGKLKSVPTTGLLLLGEAITFCDHVTMFGFYPFDHDRQNRTIPYHYWRDLTAFPSKNKTKHQFVLEYKLLAGLKKDGIIDYTEDCRVIDETKEVTGNFLEGTKEHTRPHLLRKD